MPGTIKAADFDNGGEGIAYHEATPSSGQVYRSTSLDLYEDTVVFLEAGEWLEYTIDVTTPGTYSLITQMVAIEPGRSFHVEAPSTRRTSTRGARRSPTTPLRRDAMEAAVNAWRT